MKKTYELWLDESGEFRNEASLESQKKNASLIGGILIEEELADILDLKGILDEHKIHATELSAEEKSSYVVEVLEKIDAAGGVQVFFENTEYEDEPTNRQLYLRMMAEGLLQLLQTLNAENESVILKVMIAQRQDVYAEQVARKIAAEEYLQALKSCIDEKKAKLNLFLHEKSEIKFMIRVANREQKLQIADFACNTRLTRNSVAFKNCRERVSRLHEKARLFKLSELGTVNYIKRCLVQEDISSALMELYLLRDSERKMHRELLKIIMKRIKRTNYRLMKSQLIKYSAAITAYAAKQEDYEVGERILLKINEELIPLLQKENQPYQRLQITILLQLADMYLAEGDIDKAEMVVLQCEESHKTLGNQLEDLQLWYDIQAKKARVHVRSFDFQGAVNIMEDVCAAFEGIMKALSGNELVSRRFGSIHSEFYGEALYMRIYALLFMQREHPELYGKMCELSDAGMEQYAGYEEELERHRQFRSHIELEAGNYEAALRWLLLAKCDRPEQVGQAELVDFLSKISKKDDELSRQRYMLYYLLIMGEAKIKQNPLADLMFQALDSQKKFLEEVKLVAKEEALGFYEIPIEKVAQEATGILYHPQEIMNWKYATYLWKAGQPWRACAFYEKAMEICFKYPEYDAMQMIGVGIAAEYICCLNEIDKKSAKRQYESMIKKMEQLEKEPLPGKTKSFLYRLLELANKALKKKGKLDCQYLWELSRKITY